MSKSANELGLEIDELEKQYLEACHNRDLVEMEMNRIDREVIDHRKSIGDLHRLKSEMKDSHMKARHLAQEIRARKFMKINEFHTAKEMGL
jgi:hypothetical protein